MQERQTYRTMLTRVDEAYGGALKPVLRKHAGTLERLGELMDAGDTTRAEHLWRRSGLLDDLAKAIAGSGKVAADAIREGLQGIREAVKRETG